MRRIVLVTLVLAALVGSAVHAQSGTYTGVSIGFPLLVNAHYGLEDLLAPGVDLRLNLGGAALGVGGYWVYGGVLGADALYRFGHEDEARTVVPYAGGGLGVVFLGAGGGGGGADVGFALNGAGALGVEYLLEDVGLFAEGRVNLSVAGGGTLTWLNVGFGVNFRR